MFFTTSQITHVVKVSVLSISVKELMRFPRESNPSRTWMVLCLKTKVRFARGSGGANFRLAFFGNRHLKWKNVRFPGSVLVQKGTLFSIDFNQ